MVKILQGGLIDKKSKQKQTNENETPSWVRRTAGPITAALGFPGNVVQGAQNVFSGAAELVNKHYPDEPMTGKRLPWDKREVQPKREMTENPFTTNELRNKVSEKTGYERESLQPKGFGEEVIDLTAGNLPLAFMTGGLSAATVGRDLLGSAGQLTARKAGLGTPGEIGGAIIGANLPELAKWGGTKILNAFGKSASKQKPQNVLSHVKDVTRENFNNSTEALKGKSGPAAELVDSFEKYYDDISVGFENAENKQALKDFSHAMNQISEGKLDINKAKLLKQSFSNEAYNKNHSSGIREKYRQAADTIKGWIYGQEETLGQGISDYKRANELHTLVKDQEKLERIIDSNATLSSLLSKSFLKSIFSTGVKVGGIKPISRAARFFGTPEAQKYWGQATKALAIDNKDAVVSSLTKLGRGAIEFSAKNVSNIPRGIKVLSGGLL